MAYPSYLLDNEPNEIKQISANTVEDLEFLKSVARLLKANKSVRKTIDIIDEICDIIEN
jgi:urease gamma subunit